MNPSDGGRIEVVRQVHAGAGTGTDDLVAWITIDNQAKLNVLGSRLIGELRAAFEALAAEPGLRAVVLTGAGARAFIGGADIAEMAALTPETARTFITGLHALCNAIQALPVPVIARIQGYCLGAGLEVAAACGLGNQRRGHDAHDRVRSLVRSTSDRSRSRRFPGTANFRRARRGARSRPPACQALRG